MATSPAKIEEDYDTIAQAMKLRVYPTYGQIVRTSQWLWVVKRFRNEAVEFLKNRRVSRAKWKSQHPVLAKNWTPEEFLADDVGACSKWLTARLETSRRLAQSALGIKAGPNTAVEKVQAWLRHAKPHLTKDEVNEIMNDVWLLTVQRTVLDQCLQDLKKTNSKADGDRKKAKKGGKKPARLAGFPTFRKYSHAGSVRIQVIASKNKAFAGHWLAGKLMLPGLGLLRFRDSGYVLPKTPPQLITLSRSACGQWSVSFVCIEGEYAFARKAGRKLPPPILTECLAKGLAMAPLPLDRKTGLPAIEGLDASMGHRAVSNRHGYPERISHHERYIRKGKTQQRSLSRKVKGSGHYHRVRIALAKTHEKIATTRRAEILGHVKEITERSAIICTETLGLAFMLKNRHLSRAAHNTALGLFFELLEQESAKLGRLVLKSARFAATTQTCPCCGLINRELKNNLKLREWTCLQCTTFHDRDIAAGDNIQAMALQHAIEQLESSSGSENEPRMLSSHRLHPDLEAFIVRGGLTAALEHHRSRVSQAAGKTTVATRVAKAPRVAVEACVLPKKPITACREQAVMG